MIIAELWKDVCGLPHWLRAVLASLVGALIFIGAYELWAHHERSIGAKDCENRVTMAQAAAEKADKALQAKIDADAKERDRPLQEVVHSVPAVSIGCKLTPAQIDTIARAMK